jgi:hypothetical protein
MPALIFYPSIQVMVAVVHSEQIGNEKVASFIAHVICVPFR